MKIDNFIPVTDTESVSFIQTNHGGGVVQTTPEGLLRIVSTASDVSSSGHINIGTPQNKVSTVPVTSGMFGLGSLNTLTTILNVNGAGAVTKTWAGATTSLNQTNLLAELNTITGLTAAVASGVLTLTASTTAFVDKKITIVTVNGVSNTITWDGLSTSVSQATLLAKLSTLPGLTATVDGSTQLVLTADTTPFLNSLTTILNVNGAGATTITWDGTSNSASKANMLAALNAINGLTATMDSTTGEKLLLQAATSIVVGNGTANAMLGLVNGSSNNNTVGYRVVPSTVYGVANVTVGAGSANALLGIASTTPGGVVNGNAALASTIYGIPTVVVGAGTGNTIMGLTAGTYNYVTSGAVAAAGYAQSTLHGLTLILTIGGVATTLTCAGSTNTASSSALVTAINTTFSITSYLNNSSQIVIPTTATLVVGAGTANTMLGLTAGTILGRTAADIAKDISPIFIPPTSVNGLAVCREVVSANGGTLTFAYPSQVAGGYTSTYILPAGQIIALQAAIIYTTASSGPTDLIVRF